METIQNVSKKECRYCPGLQNLADLASRGAPALVNSQLWWNGPEWLSLEEEKWPDSEQLYSLVQKNIDHPVVGACGRQDKSVGYCKTPTNQDSDEDYISEVGSHKPYKCYVCLFTFVRHSGYSSGASSGSLCSLIFTCFPAI